MRLAGRLPARLIGGGVALLGLGLLGGADVSVSKLSPGMLRRPVTVFRTWLGNARQTL